MHVLLVLTFMTDQQCMLDHGISSVGLVYSVHQLRILILSAYGITFKYYTYVGNFE